MKHAAIFRCGIGMVALIGAVGGLGAPTAVAQTVPYKASGTDAEFSPVTGLYEGTGNGTHVGKHVVEGVVDLPLTELPLPGDEPDVFYRAAFTGSQVIVAANGDILAGDFVGEVKLRLFDPTNLDRFATGTWEADLFIDSAKSTGRFANASGTLRLVAINPPFNPFADSYPFDWFVEGHIDLGKKKR